MISYDPKNWIRVLFDFPRSPVFRTLFFDVLGAGAWAALVTWIELEVVGISVPLGPSFLSILGIILGLLLVFRTNTAYDRWWEGRRQWGHLVNVSRGLSQQLGASLAGEVHAARRARYAQLLGEFPVALAAHLRRRGGTEDSYRPNELIRALHAEVQADLAGAASRRSIASPSPPCSRRSTT